MSAPRPIPCLIPIRNGLTYTRECLRSLWAQDVPVRVWIINNASTDGSAEWLAAEQARHRHALVVTHHLRPLSVAASWNYGLTHLFAEGEPAVAVLNNDTLFRPDFIRELAAANLPFATGVGVATLEQRDAPFVRCDREHPDFSAYLIRRECWERVGRFDERCKGAFVEDCRAHVKAWRLGIHLTCIGIPFWHAASGTIKSASPEDRLWIEQRANANRQAFLDEFGCLPGSEEYTQLFRPELFGVDSRVTRDAEPR